MKVIVDTNFWALALMRDIEGSLGPVNELQRIIHSHRVQMIDHPAGGFIGHSQPISVYIQIARNKTD